MMKKNFNDYTEIASNYF